MSGKTESNAVAQTQSIGGGSVKTVRLGVQVSCTCLDGRPGPKGIAGQFELSGDDPAELRTCLDQKYEDWLKMYLVDPASVVITGGGMSIKNGAGPAISEVPTELVLKVARCRSRTNFGGKMIQEALSV